MSAGAAIGALIGWFFLAMIIGVAAGDLSEDEHVEKHGGCGGEGGSGDAGGVS
jgi:hypothetical protein